MMRPEFGEAHLLHDARDGLLGHRRDVAYPDHETHLAQLPLKPEADADRRIAMLALSLCRLLGLCKIIYY